MVKLHTGDTSMGAARLLKAIAEADAEAVIAFRPKERRRTSQCWRTPPAAGARRSVLGQRMATFVSQAEHGPCRRTDFLRRPKRHYRGAKRGSMSAAEIRTEVATGS